MFILCNLQIEKPTDGTVTFKLFFFIRASTMLTEASSQRKFSL